MRVLILLSTFNGEKYLHEQLDSIFNQTYSDFTLIVRDDGSIDGTVAILEEYQKRHSTRMKILLDELGNIGVAPSYRLLMEKSNADFYLFADQDDIWESNKIETLMEIALQESDVKIPFLVFSNILVFNQESCKTYDLFKKHRILKSEVYLRGIHGCSMLFNDACKYKNLEFNSNIERLHDWQILLTAYIFGTIEHTNKKLLRYRIHDSNVVGECLEKSTTLLVKDFLKYVFKSSDYRKITLSNYYDFITIQKNTIPEELRLKKELYIEAEVNKLSYYQRKKWYLKYFNPFLHGKLNGLIIMMTI